MIDLKLFSSPNSQASISLHNLIVSHSANTGIGQVAREINKYGESLQMRASYSVRTTGDKSIGAGDISGLKINGISIGNINGINTGDSDGKLIAAINSRSELTGVEAFVDQRGFLNLKSVDGRGMIISSDALRGNQADLGLNTVGRKIDSTNYGRLTLTRLDSRDIVISAVKSGSQSVGLNVLGMREGNIAETTVNLKDSLTVLTRDQSSALGIYDNKNVTEMFMPTQGGVLTTVNSLNIMNIADSALDRLNRIRASVGSTQKRLERVIDNLSITSVNIRSAESNIRDVDFADETREFQKYQILAQSGNYALSQANATQQLILKLLQ
jgi:flagellin